VLSGRRKRTQEEKIQRKKRPEDQKCAEISRVGKRKEGCCCAQLLCCIILSYISFLFHIGKVRTNI
jgi:hypothetical protein